MPLLRSTFAGSVLFLVLRVLAEVALVPVDFPLVVLAVVFDFADFINVVFSFPWFGVFAAAMP